jgi:hypothetical protein
MATYRTENWDSDCTPPALPSGWSVSGAGWTTTTSGRGVSPVSSPNMLEFNFNNTTVSDGYYFCTYDFLDTAGGNVAVQCSIASEDGADPDIVAQLIGVTARGNSSSLSSGSATGYAAWMNTNAQTAGLSKITTGGLVDLTTISGVTYTADGWYQIVFNLYGSNLSVVLIRSIDNYYLTSTGAWQSTLATAIDLYDTTYSESGYAGLIGQATSVTPWFGYFDNWNYGTASVVANQVMPHPLVVYYPHQYYPRFAE